MSEDRNVSGQTKDEERLWNTYVFQAWKAAAPVACRAGFRYSNSYPDCAKSAQRISEEAGESLCLALFSAFLLEYRLRATLHDFGKEKEPRSLGQLLTCKAPQSNGGGELTPKRRADQKAGEKTTVADVQRAIGSCRELPEPTRQEILTLLKSGGPCKCFWCRLAKTQRRDGKGDCQKPNNWPTLKEFERLQVYRDKLVHAEYRKALECLPIDDSRNLDTEACDLFNFTINVIEMVGEGTGYPTRIADLRLEKGKG